MIHPCRGSVLMAGTEAFPELAAGYPDIAVKAVAVIVP